VGLLRGEYLKGSHHFRKMRTVTPRKSQHRID
jgi:hypothetical protein